MTEPNRAAHRVERRPTLADRMLLAFAGAQVDRNLRLIALRSHG